MPTTRRRLLPSMGLAALAPASAQQTAITLQALRGATELRGESLPDNRLRVLQPILERRRTQLQPLRDFSVDDAILPVAGPKRHAE